MTGISSSTMTSISSSALNAAPRLAVAQAQAALSKAQVELSSGKLADIGLGLGSATGTYVSLGVQSNRLQAITASNNLTAAKLTATTTALDTLRTSATSFFASLTAAATGGTVPSTLVTTATANLGSLTGTLNTSVGGDAIFGGINSSVSPMTTYAAGSPAKAAVDASFSTAFGTTQSSASASSISGTDMQSYLSNQFASLFGAASYKGTWSAASDQNTSAQISTTESVDTSVSANAAPFRQLAQAYTMVQEFGGSNFGTAAGQAVIASATALVSSALTGLTTTEAGVGLSQSSVSAANDSMATQISYLSTQSSGLVDVDPSTLATQISGLQTQIQASYEVTSQLQQLSLVNYLK